MLEKLKASLEKIKKVKISKIHLEYITAILSIPVLLTAIIINFINLTKKNPPVTPTPVQKIILVSPSVSQIPSTSTLAASQSASVCQKAIGPISISSPTEGATVTDNPVCFLISYSDPNYCSVVWSYKINNGNWSDYNSDSPCLYNLPNGAIDFQLRVDSTASSAQQLLTRNISYQGNSNLIPTPTPTARPTPSATPLASPSPTGATDSSPTPTLIPTTTP